MAPFFQDDLKNVTATLLQDWTPETAGDSWTRLWGDASTSFQVISTGLRSSGNSGNVGYIYTANAASGYPTANYEVQVTLVSQPTSVRTLYILARVTDQENMYAARLVLGTGTCQLYKKVSGTWTAIGSTFDCPAAGSVLKLSVNGTSISFLDDGVEVASATDSSLSSTGEAGLAHGGGAELVVSTDDTNATTWFSDFSVNDLGSGGGDTELVVADVTHSHTAETVALTQAYVLSPSDVSHAHASALVDLLQAYVLTVAGADHAHAVDNLDLSQSILLVVADVTHAHAVDNLGLLQAHVLSVQDVEHPHTAEALNLLQAYVLTVGDASHSHTAEALDLIQDYLLSVQGADHAHAVEVLTLLQDYLLSPADVTHLHSAENVILILPGQFVLEVQDVTHVHEAGTLDLVQAYVLSPEDVQHAHQVQDVSLVQNYLLVVQGADHAHAVGTPDLLQAYVLSPEDVAHLHAAGTITLVVDQYFLEIQDVTHGHSVQSPILVFTGPHKIAPRIIVVGPRDGTVETQFGSRIVRVKPRGQ